MWPTLIELDTAAGPVAAHTYGLLVLAGFVAGFGYLATRARQVGIDAMDLMWLFSAAALGGLPGARLLYVISTGEASALLSASGGFTYYGGLLGGAAAVAAVAAWRRVDALKLGDIALPAVVLGNAIGRVGCLFAGCCHGAVLPRPDPRTALLPDDLLHGQIWLHPHPPFLSTEFHDGVGRLLHEPLYPTQIWQSVGAFAVFVLLDQVWRRRRFDGQVMATMLLVEPLVRSVVEVFRADHRGYAVSWTVQQVPAWLSGLAQAGDTAGVGASGPVTLGVTTSQGIGLGMMLLGAGLWWWRRDAGVAPETPARDVWDDDLDDLDDLDTPAAADDDARG